MIFDEFLTERNRALVNLDIAWARSQLRIADGCSDELILISLHKARYECTAIDDLLRHQSGQWLRDRGFKRLYGQEFEPELPK